LISVGKVTVSAITLEDPDGAIILEDPDRVITPDDLEDLEGAIASTSDSTDGLGASTSDSFDGWTMTIVGSTASSGPRVNTQLYEYQTADQSTGRNYSTG
jgi:hypothetical protein